MRSLPRWTAAALLVCVASALPAQNKKDDIPVDQLPAAVRTVLEDYVKLLRTSPDVASAAKGLVAMAGGGLVEPAGNALRGDVSRYSLKKDHAGIKAYADPIQITRVNRTATGGHGFGPSAIRGQVYKIWIAKAAGVPGLPAPVSIMVPEGHPTIKTPKVVTIGSL